MDYKKMVTELSDLFVSQFKGHETLTDEEGIYGIFICMDESAYCIGYQTLESYKEEVDGCDDEQLKGSERFTGIKYLADLGMWNYDDCEVNFDSMEKSQELANIFDSIETIDYRETVTEDPKSIDWVKYDLKIPRSEFPENIGEFRIKFITDAINETKDKLDFLDLTDDFVMFMYPLDYGEDEVFENILPLTVDSELIKKKQAL